MRGTKPKARDHGPRWPVAHQAASYGGLPFAVSVVGVRGQLVVVAVDGDGVLVELVRKNFRSQIVRWCLERTLRFYSTLGELVEALESGRVRPWLHGVQLESRAGRRWRVMALPLSVSGVEADAFWSPDYSDDVDDDAGEFADVVGESLEAEDWPSWAALGVEWVVQ